MILSTARVLGQADTDVGRRIAHRDRGNDHTAPSAITPAPSTPGLCGTYGPAATRLGDRVRSREDQQILPG